MTGLSRSDIAEIHTALGHEDCAREISEIDQLDFSQYNRTRDYQLMKQARIHFNLGKKRNDPKIPFGQRSSDS